MIRFEYRNLLHSKHIPTAIAPERIADMSSAILDAHDEIGKDRQADILGFYALPEQNVSHHRFCGGLTPVRHHGGAGDRRIGPGQQSRFRPENGRELPRRVLVYDNVWIPSSSRDSGPDRSGSHLFNVITSGTTAETMAGYMILADIVQKRFPRTIKADRGHHGQGKGFLASGDQEGGLSLFRGAGQCGRPLFRAHGCRSAILSLCGDGHRQAAGRGQGHAVTL